MTDRKLLLQNTDINESSIKSPKISSSKGGKMMLAISRRNSIGSPAKLDTSITKHSSLKRRMHPIDEDTYSSQLQSIISRDYFSVDQSNDQTPSMSLDQYQAKFTSEDNRDFNDLAHRQNMELRKKAPWLYGERKLLNGTSTNNRLEDSSKDLIKDKSNSSLSSNRNALMFPPENLLESHHRSDHGLDRVDLPYQSTKKILRHNTRTANLSSKSNDINDLWTSRTTSRSDEVKTYDFVKNLSSKKIIGFQSITNNSSSDNLSSDHLKVRKRPLTPAARRMLQRVSQKTTSVSRTRTTMTKTTTTANKSMNG